MAAKKDNQLKTVEETNESVSTITYANEVIATIAGMAVADVEGIAGMVPNPGAKIGGKNKNVTKGIKVEVGPEEVSCEIYVLIEYGRPIQKVAVEVQENVRRSLETMTGLHVVRVDVHVQGVSFEKENSALTAGAQNARLTGETAEKPAEKTEDEA
ncbi:MAG: Asp23/Gls24 family envelope stress response protein [Clostridia bacterium]|nr:Asp23/Gls24 family envelope stress response protein [Clostridia bacterium]